MVQIKCTLPKQNARGGCIANGSGCGVCIRICPFNKPECWLHDFTRIMIGAGSGSIDSLLVNLDDAGGYGKNELTLKWWHWLLTVLGILYAIFVLELIVGFFGEGAPQAALVMGGMTGIVAVIWGALLVTLVGLAIIYLVGGQIDPPAYAFMSIEQTDTTADSSRGG